MNEENEDLTEEEIAEAEREYGAEEEKEETQKPEAKPEPILTEEKEETPKHVVRRAPPKCPLCGAELTSVKLKTKNGVINARYCEKCRKATY